MTATVEQLEPPAGIMPAEGNNTALVPSKQTIELLTIMANNVAESGLGVGGCRTPGAAFYKMMLGWEHGIRPMTALSSIDVIEGKGCLQAHALAATVEARGIGSIRIGKLDDNGCTVIVTKPEWNNRTEEVSYTLQDASAAGFLTIGPDGKIAKHPNGAAVCKKKNWSTNYQDMYFARATGRAYRRWFRVASLGLSYTREELEDGVGDDAPLGVQLDKPKPNWTVPGQPEAATATPSEAPAPATGAAVPSQLTAQPAPTVTPTVPDQVASGDPAVQIKELYMKLGIDKNDWALMMERRGIKSLKEANDETKAEVLTFLRHVDWTRRLVTIVNFSPEKFAKALEKRGVAKDIHLTLPAITEIYGKLAELKTPFELQELGIGPNTGATLGNGQSPAEPTSQPSAQETGLPPMPPG